MKLFKSILLGLSSCLFFTNCDPLEQVGPRLCPTEDFVFTKDDVDINIVGENPGELSNNSEISLNGNGVHVYSKFSEVVRWKIIFEMLDGTAEKIYSGESDSINVFWYGNSKAFPLFSKGEVKVTVDVSCRDIVQRSFKIIENPTFKAVDPTYGMLVRDWDLNGDLGIEELGVIDLTWGKDGFNWAQSATVKYMDSIPSPQGGYYLSFYDKKEIPTWYYGTTGLDRAMGKIYKEKLEVFTPISPDSLWLNLYVSGVQSYENTSLELVWGLGSETETYVYTEHLNWEGWKMISIPFSEFKKGTDRMTVFDGFNSNDRSYLGFQLGSQPLQDTEAQASFDFVIITVGSPFFDE